MAFNSRQLSKAFIKVLQTYPDREKEVVSAFLNFVEVKKLSSCLPNILRHLENEFTKMVTDEKLKIVTGQKLSETSLDQIRDRVSAGPEVVIEQVEDKNLIGGFVAYFNGLVYDGSVLGQIVKLKNNLQK